MLKKISDLDSFELEQFKNLYIKYFIEEAKRTDLGFSLLYELVTKKRSKAIVDAILEKINNFDYLGYAYTSSTEVLGFIVGHANGNGPARITEGYVAPVIDSRLIALDLYRKLAFAFKMRGKRSIVVETSQYNNMLMKIIRENNFEVSYEYLDDRIEYEKTI